jgi:hypothetical protein
VITWPSLGASIRWTAAVALLSLAPCVSTAVAQSGSQATEDSIRTLLEALPCTPFEWLPWNGVTPRGGIAVPIELEGRTYRFQLDTGSDATMIYGNEAERRGWVEPGRTSQRVGRIRLGGIQVPPSRLITRPEIRPGADELAGTVGLDLLLGHVVVLDYPRQRFCVVPRADVPRLLFRRTTWADAAEIRNGKLFVTVTMAGNQLDALFFDTGASYLAVSVDVERWKAITGRAGEDEATERVMAGSWGKQVAIHGAPARGPLRVGALRLGCPMIYYRPDAPTHFEEFPYPAEGSLGNAPFWSAVVVLDLGVWPAFGILTTPGSSGCPKGDAQRCAMPATCEGNL